MCTCFIVGIVDFISIHLGGRAPRAVVLALHREVVETHHQHFSFPPSSQQLSEAVQQVVKERRMTWFQFAQYLLRSKETCPLVFEISNYTCGESDSGDSVHSPNYVTINLLLLLILQSVFVMCSRKC